jgi:hypothetical protein
MLLAFFLAAQAYSHVDLLGWTREGMVAFEARIDPGPFDGMHTGDDEGHYTFLVVMDQDGAVRRIFRKERSIEREPWPEGEATWRRAEPESAGAAWSEEHPVDGSTGKALEWKANADVEQVPLAFRSARARLVRKGAPQRCGISRLLLDTGAGPAVLIEDRCPARSAAEFRGRETIETMPSLDGGNVAVAWNYTLLEPAGGTQLEAGHGYVVIAGARPSPLVDLLDAGAGKDADTMAKKLEEGGFRIAHRAKAQKPRPSTAIYFTKGHAGEAKEIAKLLGVPGEAVQEATWKTPFAVTVAAGPGLPGKEAP